MKKKIKCDGQRCNNNHNWTKSIRLKRILKWSNRSRFDSNQYSKPSYWWSLILLVCLFVRFFCSVLATNGVYNLYVISVIWLSLFSHCYFGIYKLFGQRTIFNRIFNFSFHVSSYLFLSLLFEYTPLICWYVK